MKAEAGPATVATSATSAAAAAAAAAATVEVRSLAHAFRRGGASERVLSGVDLTIVPGETVALLGRSGSGKSTLLNIVGGLVPVQSGEVRLFGESLGALDDRARTLLRRERIGFVHQAFNLVPTLSVADNITLPLALGGADAAARRAVLDELLDAIGLVGRGDDAPDTLSGGEQQRVAIARALAHRPPLLLADEPTGNLDAASGRRVLALLRELVVDPGRADGAAGSAMLVVTHSLEVARIADRALALRPDGLQALDAAQLDGSSAW